MKKLIAVFLAVSFVFPLAACGAGTDGEQAEPVSENGAPAAAEETEAETLPPIPGAEHMLVSMPMRFMESRKMFPDYTAGPGVSDMLLMTSRDGHAWDRPILDGFIRGGLYAHEWTQRCFIPLGGVIPRGERFLFYVEQNYMWDDDGIWVYAVPRFRFMSLWADGRGGVLRTKELRFETDDIYLNFATSAYGYLKVRILDSDGNRIHASEELFGNDLSRRLRFEVLAGKTGRMEIEFREADLYALGSDMSAG